MMAHGCLDPGVGGRQRTVALLCRASQSFVLGRGALPLRAPLRPALNALGRAHEVVVVDTLGNEARRPMRDRRLNPRVITHPRPPRGIPLASGSLRSSAANKRITVHSRQFHLERFGYRTANVTTVWCHSHPVLARQSMLTQFWRQTSGSPFTRRQTRQRLQHESYVTTVSCHGNSSRHSRPVSVTRNVWPKN